MGDNVTVAFCITDLKTVKHAALFYDIVVPFPSEALPKLNPELRLSQQVVQDIWKFIPEKCYNKLLGPIAGIMGNPDAVGMIGHEFRATFLTILLGLEYSAVKVLSNENIYKENIVKSLAALERFGIVPIVVLPEEKLRSRSAVADDVSVTLSDIKLIDTEAASWEQIMEVRHDEEARKKLRNLRLFLQTSYTDKSRQFIKDDLAKRLDDYQKVVKDYGFETLTSALTVITNSKNLVTFGTASLAALLFGEPILASASLLTGASLEIANVSLELAKKRHAFRKFKRDHDLGYIIDIRERFDKSKSKRS